MILLNIFDKQLKHKYMKKTLLSILSLIGLTVTSQTLTETNHAPGWWNPVYITNQCDSFGVNPGASGAGAIWTFNPSNLHSLKTYTTSNTAPNNPSYPSANVSVYSSVNNTSFYNSNSTTLKYYGGNLVINSNDLVLKYSSPALVGVYPMSLNTTTTSITSGTVSLTIFGIPLSPAFNGTCTVTADATGTLVLPAKTFTDVIRLSTSQVLAASGATVNSVNYDYYSISASKAPIYSIQTSTIDVSGQPTSSQTVTIIQPNYSIVGINEAQKSSIELSVYPNPAATVINFATTSTDAVKVLAFDVTGKLVATEVLEMGKAKMNLINLSSGMYIYHVVDKNNLVLKSDKFNVSK